MLRNANKYQQCYQNSTNVNKFSKMLTNSSQSSKIVFFHYTESTLKNWEELCQKSRQKKSSYVVQHLVTLLILGDNTGRQTEILTLVDTGACEAAVCNI